MAADIAEKLMKMSRYPGMVLFRWITLRNKIEGCYSALADIRLEILYCGSTTSVFRSLAPVFNMSATGPVISMEYADVRKVTKGIRMGINILQKDVKDSDADIQAYSCGQYALGVDALSEHVKLSVIAIMETHALPVARMIYPPLYRMSKSMDAFTPCECDQLLELLQIDAAAGSADDMLEAFRTEPNKTATQTKSGWVIPFELVHKGGMICVQADAIRKIGGSVYKTDVNLLPRYFKTAPPVACTWQVPASPAQQMGAAYG